MLGADAVEGAVEPGLHVAEQDMDDGQHGISVFTAVLNDRVVAKAVGESVVALQTIGDDAGAGLSGAADKAAQIRRGGSRQNGDAGAAGDKVALLDTIALARKSTSTPMRRSPRRRLASTPGSASTTRSASTKASAIARRGRFTKKACGYVDDRLRRPAPLPPHPEQARQAGKCSPSPTYPQAPQPTKDLISMI